MIGEELAHRVSPVAALRPELLMPDGSQDCWSCGAAFTSCSHSTQFEAPETTFADWVKTQVAAKASQQTVRRGPGRPPKERPEPPADTVATPDAADTPVASPETPVAPMVAPPAPEVAPVGPAPTEAVPAAPVVADAVPSTADASPVPAAPVPATSAPVDPVPMIKPPGPMPLGADYGAPGVHTLSPVAPDPMAVPRVAAASVDVGEVQDCRDVYEVPPGFMDPADDPHRPHCVLVNSPEQIWQTGAFVELPGLTSVALTQEVQLVRWQGSMSAPLYTMLAGKGSVLPKPYGV